jgi:hypothetical protein
VKQFLRVMTTSFEGMTTKELLTQRHTPGGGGESIRDGR